MRLGQAEDRAACGVGFLASREGSYRHEHLQSGLHALRCVEHRGACGADMVTSDGAGIMTDIPFELLGYDHGTIALATLFLDPHPERQRRALQVFASTFQFHGMEILKYREVPIQAEILGQEARLSLPLILHAVIQRPTHCRTSASFDKLLHTAHRHTLSRLKDKHKQDLFFPSLSANTVVYKAQVRAESLDQFYLDLQNPQYKTRFALFHRRFSTNTTSTWDKVQPFRLIGHNGEINTIQGNRSWSHSREKSLGLRPNELLTHTGISDSGSLNEMVEALMFRSSIPHIEDVLAIMMPPAQVTDGFYQFWSRAMEPWDGPAFITYADGLKAGARLDRNGFRPCRWAMTESHFYLASEAGVFALQEAEIIAKGSLAAGSGVEVDLQSGAVHFRDPSQSRKHRGAKFDARLSQLPDAPVPQAPSMLAHKGLFGYTDEDVSKVLLPMAKDGKEPIGSMGDTARPAILSDQERTFFDYFYQYFAQVTNPPLDYIREAIVTDLQTYLGSRPNIFAPKDLIPSAEAYLLESPILNLSQMAGLRALAADIQLDQSVQVVEFDICFARNYGAVGCQNVLDEVAQKAVHAVQHGASIVILTDRHANENHLPTPSLLALRAVVNALNESGTRLDASIVVETGEARNAHHIAALVAFGATAVCPILALEIARFVPSSKSKDLSPDLREQNLCHGLAQGLLKIMAKMGISVVRSYQSAKLFIALGLGPGLVERYFPGVKSPLGGLELEDIVEDIIDRVLDEAPTPQDKLTHTYQFREHNRGTLGEKHSMTNTLSKLIHNLVREKDLSLKSLEVYREYLQVSDQSRPVNIRDLLIWEDAPTPRPVDEVMSRAAIMRTFGSGAMSFGAISAESQRDLILAMKEIGGRSNSGEGGENPYYETDGLTCTIKQLASGRFGVTAEYLVNGEEVQIKIAQGAKPGEGGQLMASKVSPEIARARHAKPHVELISPAPLHDIYSIEDLKELIYELKQLKPGLRISVKLVAGAGIGTIAVGVVKAGADVIHVAGGDGGTGAASLISMKHAGLPWELGLMEVHRVLVESQLRDNVILRVDGGLHRGKDIILASIMGAQEFDFGKLLLIAEGCVMARICEKNTCPTGIATHDPKFKAKYKGKPEHIVTLLEYLADDVRQHLATMGVSTLDEVLGRTDYLKLSPARIALIEARKLDLSFFLEPIPTQTQRMLRKEDEINPSNQQILQDARPALEGTRSVSMSYPIHSSERAVLATLAGEIAQRRQERQKQTHDKTMADRKPTPSPKPIRLMFTGSGGQGFGVFMVDGMEIRLFGEANDSVCKSMSGGKVVIQPSPRATFVPETNTIIGNCALYGATGGTLYARGLAGARFAVRNSGATAVVEGVGLHACEYMTGGDVIILGEVAQNLGAGMTGGTVYVLGDPGDKINDDYIAHAPLLEEDTQKLYATLYDYAEQTASQSAIKLLENWADGHKAFRKYLPIAQAIPA